MLKAFDLVRHAAAIQANKRRSDYQFELGQQVLVSQQRHFCSQLGPSGPLAPRAAGPFTIIKRLTRNTFVLDIPPSILGRASPVFHANDLIPYASRLLEPEAGVDPPDVIADDTELSELALPPEPADSSPDDDVIVLTDPDALPVEFNPESPELFLNDNPNPDHSVVEQAPLSIPEESLDFLPVSFLPNPEPSPCSYDPADAELSLDSFPWDPSGLHPEHPELTQSDQDDPPSDWLIDLNNIPDVSPLNPPDVFPSHNIPLVEETAPSQVLPADNPPIPDSLRSALARTRSLPVNPELLIPNLIQEARVAVSSLLPSPRVHFGETDVRIYHHTLPTPRPLRSIQVGEGLVGHPEQSEHPMTPVSKVPLIPVPNPMGIPPFGPEEEVKLAPWIFWNMVEKLQYQPELDLFASKRHHQLPAYITADKCDMEAIACNAFNYTWHPAGTYYANPPWSLISFTLQKAFLDGVTLLIVTPDWPHAAWYSLLEELSVRHTMFQSVVPE